MLINTKIFWITYFLNACENDHIEETYSLQAILNEPYSNFDNYKDNFSVDEEYFCNNKEFCEHNTQEVSFSDNKNCLISTHVQSKKKEPANNSNETLPLLGNSYVIILSKNTSIISNLEVIKINNSSELPENNDNIADSKKEIVNNCDCSNSKRDHVVNSNYTLIKGLKGRYNALLKNYMLEIKDSIIKFIEQKISKRHLDCYIKRLESMERAYTDFLIFNDKNIGDDFLIFPQDSELLSFLISLHLKFRKRNKFNQGNCQNFSKQFDLDFSNKMKQFLTIEPNTKTNNYSKYNFYIEMMNLYRFVDEMPELLALCGSFNDKAYFANPLVLHIINLFLRKVGNIKENKSFVMFLIYKAFKFSQKSKQNFFMVEKYDIACNKKHPYLHFFFWELSLAKRNYINKKIKLCDLVKCKDVDKMHLKIVLIIYLYTHIDFLCFYDFKGREIAIFIKFIKKVLDSKDCFACNFDEYLEITKKQLSFLKDSVIKIVL